MIQMDRVVPNPLQPRTHMDRERIKELSQDIKENGLLQPIIIRPKGETFEIVCGHRRYEAHKLIDAKTIQCIIQEMDDFNALLTAVRENKQREDLSPFDEARTYQKFLDMGISQRKLAKLLNISQTKISQALAMSRLPECVERAVISQLITLTHAQELLKLVRFMDEIGLDDFSQYGAIAYKIDEIIMDKQSVADLRYAIDEYICGFVDHMLIISPEDCLESKGWEVNDENISMIKKMRSEYKSKIPFKYFEMAMKIHVKCGDFKDFFE